MAEQEIGSKTYIDHLEGIAANDVASLREKDAEYGGSWKKRGGVGAVMMLLRKADRIEVQAKKHGWDIFAAYEADMREEGILDDIRDLRRYLLLVEGELIVRSEARKQVTRRSGDA